MANGTPPTKTPKPGSSSYYASAYATAYERAYEEARKAIVKHRKATAQKEADLSKRFELLGPREVERDAKGEIVTELAAGDAPPKTKPAAKKPVDPFLPARKPEDVDSREIERAKEAYEYGWEHGWEDGITDGAEADLTPPM